MTCIGSIVYHDMNFGAAHLFPFLELCLYLFFLFAPCFSATIIMATSGQCRNDVPTRVAFILFSFLLVTSICLTTSLPFLYLILASFHCPLRFFGQICWFCFYLSHDAGVGLSFYCILDAYR
jgi:hypothetical protein